MEKTTTENSLHINTPLLHSLPISKYMGVPVYLKMDSVQPSGSFKIRGLGTACKRAVERGATTLVTASGGNAGKAVAYSGRILKVSVHIVVPSTTSEYMQNLIKEEGAQVTVHGSHFLEADAFARTLVTSDKDTAYIPPYDSQDVWDGNSSLMEEISKQMSNSPPSVVICVVGGGGLLCGVAQGMHSVGWNHIPILAVETIGAHSYHAAIQAGEPVTLPGITSVAKTLGAARVCDEAFNWSKKRTIIPCLVSDKEAVSACLRFADEHRTLVEVSCGAGLAAIYEKKKELLDLLPSSILIIVCGGNMATISYLQSLEKQLTNSS